MDYKNTLMWQDICDTPQVLAEIMQKNGDVMKSLVKKIKGSSATNFVAAARGASDHALIFFKYVLEVKSNYTVGLSAPSVITLYNGKINYSNSIVIACSQSGQAADVLEVIKKGNEQGAITIAVTNDKLSPIAKEAKFHLFCGAGEKRTVAATKTFSAEVFLLLWLAAELSDDKEALFTLKNLKTYIEDVIPKIDAETSKYTDKFKDMTSGFILARGLIYAIALESALVLQETSYIQVKGYPGSEFYHGPLAMVNEKTPVIIFCAQNDGDEEIQSIVRADQIQCIEKMLSLKAPVLLITNDFVLTGKFRTVNEAYINFTVPEEFTIFAFALFAQMFACKISCAIGNDPDNPRALNKVTITK